jgi:hypothetical protein
MRVFPLGGLPLAERGYRQTLRIVERLVAADPTNADWQRDLLVSRTRVGDVWRAQGNLAGALGAYEELAPLPSGWQGRILQTRFGNTIFRSPGTESGTCGARRGVSPERCALTRKTCGSLSG